MCGLRYRVTLSNVWWDDDKEMHLLPRTWTHRQGLKAHSMDPDNDDHGGDGVYGGDGGVRVLHLSVDSTDIVNIDMDDKYSL